MARISNYALDTDLSQDDRILGSSYEGMVNNKPVYKTRTYKISELSDYFSNNFNIDGVNYNINELQDYQINLANSIGDPNQDGSLANISVQFANDLVAAISTVPGTFTELALTNLSAIPQTFADFLFSIANINETFANQVLDLASSTAYTTIDTFNALDAFVTQINSNVQGLQADVTSITGDINTLTGEITANASDLEALGIRVTTTETDVVALETDFTNLSISVNDLTGEIAANATSISTLGVAIDTANTDVAALQADVILLQTSINESTGDISAIASDVELLTTNVNTLAADVTAVDTSVTVLTTTVNQNTNDIATQATDVSLLANRVTTAESNILNTQTDVTQLTTTVNGATGNIATNASNISILQTNVDTVAANIVGIITDIQQIETSVDNITGEITANATAIDGLATRVTTAEVDVVNVAGNITTLQTNLNTQTGRIDTNVQSINTLGTIVTNNFNTLNASITTVNNARISGDSALSTRIDNIESQITNIPQTIRQDDEPAILDGNNELVYPLGSIWVDTNDNNALYILVEDAGVPLGYTWSPTTSEALGDLILSNAQLETEVNTLVTNLNAEATKLETLTSQFGSYDPATDTFTINNSSNIIADLRTYADAESTSAAKIDGINSVFNIVDANGNVIKNLATFNQEITTYVDANSATASKVSALEVEVDNNAAAITAEQTARATEDAAIASSVSALQTTVQGNSNTISVQQQSIDGIEGKYGVTIDQNGNVAGFQLLNGTGGSAFNVSVDAFNIYSGTTNANVFAVDAGQVKLNVPLNGVSGTFTGRLTAGGVDIYNDDIKLNIQSFGSQIRFVDDAGNDHTTMTASGVTGNFNIICQENVSVLAKDGAGNTVSSLLLTTPSAWLTGENVRLVADDSIYFAGTGQLYSSGFDSFLFYAGANTLQGSSTEGITIASGITTLKVDSTGVFVNGQQISSGPAVDTNYYLSNITKSGNTLTFVVTGAADQSYTFGANAFNSTTIPTNNNQLINGAGYLTDLPNAGPGAATYGSTSDAVKIDTIEVDSKGRIVNITTGATGDISAVTLVANSGSATDGDGVAQLSILGGTGISTSASGTTVTINNTITNNNQLTNGAGYVTSASIGNGTVSITGGGVLSGSGTFTLNQSAAANIEILHDTIPLPAQSNTGGIVLQSFNTDGYGHITSMTSVNLDGRYLRTLPAHTHDDRYYTEAEINSLLANYITAAYVKDNTITVRGIGVLGGSGSFTLNGNAATIDITHDTSAQGSTAYSGGTVIQNVYVDGYGHITGFGAVNLDGRYLTSLPAHTHDDRYYTEQEINSILASYATENYVTSALSPYALASSIPVYTSELVNNSGYITSSALTGYATETYVNNAVPSSSQISQWDAAYNFSLYGGTVSGNLYANDFILNSDATLKENIVDYAVKPINIQYKEYSFIGTQDKRVGVIAQELEVDHPEFIRESGLGKKSVSYIDLLLAKVAELESRIKQLENGGTT